MMASGAYFRTDFTRSNNTTDFWIIQAPVEFFSNVSTFDTTEPMGRIFGRWITGHLYSKILEILRKASWLCPLIITPKKVGKQKTWRLEIRQPCWSRNRWKSKT